jgi:threonine/homoserine/homoserine lactone efflux protein
VIELAIAAGVGLALGVITGLPLGVVNLAVAEAAQAGHRRFATQIGIGGALADMVHAGLAFLGVGRVIADRRDWTRILTVISIAVVLAYGWTVWRRRRARHLRREARGPTRGVATGFLLTLPNPAALSAWIAVAAAVWPTISATGAVVLAGGVAVGSALYFAGLARVISSRCRTPS